jgi:hypothetical protein
MTDLLDQAVVNAVFAQLALDTSLVVYDSVVPSNPTPTPPYCVVYTHVMRPDEDKDNPLTGRSAVWLVRFITHAVGSNAVAARAVTQRVRTQLLDFRPVVTNMTCGLVRMEDAQPPQRDESTGALVMDAITTYRLRATS